MISDEAQAQQRPTILLPDENRTCVRLCKHENLDCKTRQSDKQARPDSSSKLKSIQMACPLPAAPDTLEAQHSRVHRNMLEPRKTHFHEPSLMMPFISSTPAISLGKSHLQKNSIEDPAGGFQDIVSDNEHHHIAANNAETSKPPQCDGTEGATQFDKAFAYSEGSGDSVPASYHHQSIQGGPKEQISHLATDRRSIERERHKQEKDYKSRASQFIKKGLDPWWAFLEYEMSALQLVAAINIGMPRQHRMRRPWTYLDYHEARTFSLWLLM